MKSVILLSAVLLTRDLKDADNNRIFTRKSQRENRRNWIKTGLKPDLSGEIGTYGDFKHSEMFDELFKLLKSYPVCYKRATLGQNSFFGL